MSNLIQNIHYIISREMSYEIANWIWYEVIVENFIWVSLQPCRRFGRDVAWWRHQMETFSALLALCAGNSPVTGEFPTQRPVTRSFDVFVDLRLNKRLSNNREAGDLRRYRAHYDVIVMELVRFRQPLTFLCLINKFVSAYGCQCYEPYIK